MSFEEFCGWAFSVSFVIVVVGHFAFASMQFFCWRWLCGRLTNLTPGEIENTAFLGKSIGSYNASIGLGLLLSLKLVYGAYGLLCSGKLLSSASGAFLGVQMAVMAFIALTAVVGALGTKGPTIWIARFSPALIAFWAVFCGQP